MCSRRRWFSTVELNTRALVNVDDPKRPVHTTPTVRVVRHDEDSTAAPVSLQTSGACGLHTLGFYSLGMLPLTLGTTTLLDNYRGWMTGGLSDRGDVTSINAIDHHRILPQYPIGS